MEGLVQKVVYLPFVMPEKLMKRVHKLRNKWDKGDHGAFAFYLLGCWPFFSLALSLIAVGWQAIRCCLAIGGGADLLTAAVFVAAQLAGKEINRSLKQLFPQPRPEGSGKGEAPKGMPSYHSQASFFLAAYLSVGHPVWSGRVCFLVTIAVGVAYSRVYLKMHTPAQVIAGGAVGVVLALLMVASMLLLSTMENAMTEAFIDSPRGMQ